MIERSSGMDARRTPGATRCVDPLCIVSLMLALLLATPGATVSAQEVDAGDVTAAALMSEQPLPESRPLAPTAASIVHRRRIVAELATGGALTAFGTFSWAVLPVSDDRAVLAIVTMAPIALGIGTFELMHGGARLHVHRALLAGTPIDELRATERRRGRRALGFGSMLLGLGAVFGGVSPLGQGGGPNPIYLISMATFGGTLGASGVFLIEQGIYRFHFGRRGSLDRIGFGPDVRRVEGAWLVGIAGRL